VNDVLNVKLNKEWRHTSFRFATSRGVEDLTIIVPKEVYSAARMKAISNIGIAEVSGKPVKVQISVVPPDSRVTANVELDLGPNEFRQLNSLVKQLGLPNTYNARVTVKVIVSRSLTRNRERITFTRVHLKGASSRVPRQTKFRSGSSRLRRFLSSAGGRGAVCRHGGERGAVQHSVGRGNRQ
jgi:hypothetical protein